MDDWRWVLDDYAPLGMCGCLTFARDATERDVLAAFEMDADAARRLTADEARTDPGLGLCGVNGPYWVRVAGIDGWGVGIEWMQIKGDAEGVAQRLSRGREALVISTTVLGFAVFGYFVDNEWVTGFHIADGYDTRGGREPDRFADALAAVGLGGMERGELANPPSLHEATLAVLTMLTGLFGIRLLQATYEAPLLTGVRPDEYHYDPRFPG
jgi:hypothetical protein